MRFHRLLHAGPLEKSVESLWKQLQTRPVQAFRHLWRWWRLRRTYDWTPPQPEEWTTEFPAGQIPACATCPDVCCRGSRSTVLLRLSDVALFVDRGWTESFTHEKPTFSNEELEASPARQAMVNSFHWKVFPVLKQTETGQCLFLSPEGNCKIHKERPWVCRRFPYSLNIEEQSIFWADRCQWKEEATPQHKTAREHREAVFHNFFTEKVRDLLLVSMYPEELEQLGLAGYLRMPGTPEGKPKEES